MSKIKILFADHTPFVGGAQLRLAEDISFLDKKKFDPSVVIDKDSAFAFLYEKSGVPIYKISFPKLKLISPVALTRLISSVKEFKELVLKTSPDVVLANTTRTLVVAGLAKRLFGLKFHLISYLRDYDYPKWIFKLIKKEINKFLFVSKSVQDFYQIPGEVIYLGSNIEAKIKQLTSSDIIQAKKNLNINSEDYVIGYIGRLVQWKGALLLLESFKLLENPSVKLVFWGTGKGQAGDIEAKLKTYTKNNHLADKVIFAGQTTQPELAYKMMNCFVLPSIMPEPFATSVIEAALAKVPIVAAKNGGTPEFICHEINGLLVIPNDTNQLTQALLRLIKDPQLSKKLAEKSSIDARIYKVEIFVRKLEEQLII